VSLRWSKTPAYFVFDAGLFVAHARDVKIRNEFPLGLSIHFQLIRLDKVTASYGTISFEKHQTNLVPKQLQTPQKSIFLNSTSSKGSTLSLKHRLFAGYWYLHTNDARRSF
jgi:hypothetical protein